ncbi:uncharacterized protein LOC143253098 isoform X1 [Tachypleus tridentatus]|uniref:uncharacterized protein LOC143253098 isoform X1 n=1 Tax=Tachypleus tridentatus TaxID=6853 RepID=UPI003FD1BE9F
MVPGESSTMVSESVSVTETPVTFSSEIAFTKNKNAEKSGEQLTVLLSTSAVDNVTCGSAVRDRSDSISSFSGESHPVEIPGALVHPSVQQLWGTQDSLRSTRFIP